MTFGTVQIAYGNLRRRMAIYVGEDALPAITVDIPSGEADEHSFVKLVVWAYVLLHEAGRVPLGFLRQLPPWNAPSSNLLPHVRALRTWASHNLSLKKKADLATLRSSVEWFSQTCSVGTPSAPAHWKACFTKLCQDLEELLANALGACDAFENVEDRDRLTQALLERIDRNWEPYRFDEIAEEVVNSLGYSGIEITTLRSAKLAEWRTVVATSAEDRLRENLRLRIEADVLSLMGSAIPLNAEEIAQLVDVHSKSELLELLLSVRATLAAKRAKAQV